MADEPNRSAPPAEPFDVPTAPDSPPLEPFDVPISPDGPPAVPFDVSISLDAAPVAPIDVAISPSAPPGGTFDVGVSLDGPPVTPTDVPISPDVPPASPFDVPTVLDLPPAAPFDVPLALDAPPGDPQDVPIDLDAPPVVPFDVPTTQDGPPASPVDVAVQLDDPPAVPFDVPITPDQQIGVDGLWIGPTPSTGDSDNVQISRFDFDPASVSSNQDPGVPATQLLPWQTNTRGPSVDRLVDFLKDLDARTASFITNIDRQLGETISFGGPGGGALDPRALARWFKDYTNSVGSAGVAKFIAEQTVLYAMNDRVARIFDPTYFLKMLIPGSMGHVRTALDVETGLTMERVAQLDDQLLQGKVALSLDRPAGDGKVDRMDIYGPDNRYTDGQAFSVDSMVDTVLDRGSFANVPLVEKGVGAERRARFDASVLFEDRRSDGASLTRGSARLRAASGVENVAKSKHAQSAALDGVIPASIVGEQEDGSVLSQTQDPSNVIDDDDARVPLCFTDLRKDPVKNAYRSVYFRPLNLGFSSNISPEWAEGATFGRTDPVVGYQRTTRTFSVSFEVVAFSPEDLQVMYNKMVWLTSMCYPTYGADSLIKSGPVCRLRIGDVVSSAAGGIGGVIKGLSFDFNDALWELKRGMKVPRSFKVSVEFLALHDGPVGILNGVFGVLQLPPGDNQPDRNTNFAGGPTQARDAGVPDGATTLPGMFAKFGESRR